MIIKVISSPLSIHSDDNILYSSIGLIFGTLPICNCCRKIGLSFSPTWLDHQVMSWLVVSRLDMLYTTFNRRKQSQDSDESECALGSPPAKWNKWLILNLKLCLLKGQHMKVSLFRFPESTSKLAPQVSYLCFKITLVICCCCCHKHMWEFFFRCLKVDALFYHKLKVRLPISLER